MYENKINSIRIKTTNIYKRESERKSIRTLEREQAIERVSKRNMNSIFVWLMKSQHEIIMNNIEQRERERTHNSNNLHFTYKLEYNNNNNK